MAFTEGVLGVYLLVGTRNHFSSLDLRVCVPLLVPPVGTEGQTPVWPDRLQPRACSGTCQTQTHNLDGRIRV